MFDNNPVLRERLMGVGAFAGIAMFAMGAVDVLVTGGFDFEAQREPYDRAQPSAYVRVVDAAQYVGNQVQRISWDNTFGISEAQAATTEELAGDSDGSQPSDIESQPSEDELLQAVANLYEQRPSDEQYADDGYYPEEDEQPSEDPKLTSASENASPW